jgi:hypothetical protein
MTYRALSMQRACRAHLLATPLPSSTGHNVQATATGYTKDPGGNFVGAGFAVGMEVQASGFTTPGNNGIRLVTGVSTLDLAVQGGATAEGPSASHRVDVILPTRRAWENILLTPEEGFPWLAERWLGGPTTLTTTTRDGFVESTPQYQVLIYTASGIGMDAAASYADAILAHFRAGTAITDADGAVARVRGDTGPFRTALTLDTPGWSLLSLSIPLRVESRNI